MSNVRNSVGRVWPIRLLAILVAAVAAFGNVGVAWWNSREQHILERERAELNRDLETTKSEGARILEIIKTNDADRAADNLKFLLDAGLISDPHTNKSLAAYLQTRIPGKGPSLPSLVPTTAIEADPQFKQIQETVGQLGTPRLPAVLADDAYQAVYENAKIIWIKSLLSILVLPNEGGKKDNVARRYGFG
jgi:hypothetical protein